MSRGCGQVLLSPKPRTIKMIKPVFEWVDFRGGTSLPLDQTMEGVRNMGVTRQHWIPKRCAKKGLKLLPNRFGTDSPQFGRTPPERVMFDPKLCLQGKYFPWGPVQSTSLQFSVQRGHQHGQFHTLHPCLSWSPCPKIGHRCLHRWRHLRKKIDR